MTALQGITLLNRDPIYRGGFTDIYHGLYRGEDVALKRLRLFHHQPRDRERQRLRRRLAREAHIWHRLQHPNVLKFLGIDTETFPLYMCTVSQWMRHGTILQYRKTYGASNINLHRRLTEICSGINYLHMEGVVHGDLRGTNILINADGSACLADFGLTDFIEALDGESGSHHQASTRWLAPELIHPDDFGLPGFQKTRATDIYALAYVCLEIFTGRLPFLDIANDAEVIYRVIQGARPTRPTQFDDPGVTISDEIWNFMERCWEHQPLHRLSMPDVLRIIDNWNRGWGDATIRMVESAVARWLFDTRGENMCWIENSGPARTTNIARTIAEFCIRENKLAASIFFVGGPSPMEFFRNVVDQIARQFPAYNTIVSSALQNEPGLVHPMSTEELQDFLLKLIVHPMMSLRGTMALKLIVVDSLDLCDESPEMENTWLTLEILIQALIWLAESLHRNQVPLKIFVTSLPELHRNARIGIPKFQTQVRSLYLYEHGILDSSTDAWLELQRLAARDSDPAPQLSGSRTPHLPSILPIGIMSHISNWIENNRGHQVCWLRYPSRQYDHSSSAAKLLVEHLVNSGSLAAGIFCSNKNISPITFLPTLAFQLGNMIPALKPTMIQMIEDQRELLLTTDNHIFVRKLIIESFLTGDLNFISPMVVIIDAIGWSYGDFLLSILVWLANTIQNHAIPLQIFVASEPDMYTQANLLYSHFLDAALTLHLPRSDSWTTSTPTSSQSPFVDHGQKIYRNLVSFLGAKISADYSSDQRLCNNFQAYLDHMVSLGIISCLIESHRSRLQLLQMATQMQVSEHPTVRDALIEDETAIATLLEGILNSDEDTMAILALRGDDAHSFLNLLQIILSKGLISSFETGHKARRVLVKLSEISEIIPASVLIKGLVLTENQPVSGGGFADIYRATYKGQEVAVKHLRVRQDQDSQRIRRAFGHEALVWQQLKHPNVLSFIGIDSEVFPSSLCMVSPWMRHGTILDLRAANGPANINIERRLTEIAEGLEYLHAEGVIHGDLRGANILADNDWHAVLADFGLTVFGDATAATHTSNPHGAVRWMAPELLNPELFDMTRFRKTRASDVYSFACVCLEIYTGHHPFVEAANDAAVIYRVMQARRPALRAETPESQSESPIPEHVIEVIEWCWKHQPEDRPEIGDVIQIMKTWSV